MAKQKPNMLSLVAFMKGIDINTMSLLTGISISELKNGTNGTGKISYRAFNLIREICGLTPQFRLMSDRMHYATVDIEKQNTVLGLVASTMDSCLVARLTSDGGIYGAVSEMFSKYVCYAMQGACGTRVIVFAKKKLGGDMLDISAMKNVTWGGGSKENALVRVPFATYQNARHKELSIEEFDQMFVPKVSWDDIIKAAKNSGLTAEALLNLINSVSANEDYAKLGGSPAITDTVNLETEGTKDAQGQAGVESVQQATADMCVGDSGARSFLAKNTTRSLSEVTSFPRDAMASSFAMRQRVA